MKPLRAALTTMALATLTTGVTSGANGVIITMKQISGGTPETHQIQLDADHLRADTGDAKAVIFDANRQVLDIVDNNQKSYRELTKADVDRLGEQVSGAMSQMQAQMANLPPEQRARIEAMMKGRGVSPAGTDAAPKPEYRKVGTDKVGKWTCDEYDVYLGGRKDGDVCTVSASALGLSDSDFAVTKQMQTFFSALLKFAPAAQMNQMLTLRTFTAEGLNGFPIRRRQPDGDSQELSDITRGNVPESAFQVPAGFQKQAFMSGRGRQ
jgi:hypothetical protein